MAHEEMLRMSEVEKKVNISITLDECIVEQIDSMEGVKRSTLINDIVKDWLDGKNE